MEGFVSIGKKTWKALREEGVQGVAKKTVSYIHTANVRARQQKEMDEIYKDVLFINGCDYTALPHPPRYRVKHQIEQLKANSVECDEIFHMCLNINLVRNYRSFIIFRCPYTELLGEFISLAKKLNKTIIYDIDDLVIDTKFTDEIKYLNTMSEEERNGYDEGVRNMQKVLRMCDAAITTTDCLADKLKDYVPTVYINRNTASEEMLSLSEKAYQLWKKQNRDNNKALSKVKLGYFSGSITHNDDFDLIKPAICKLMGIYPQVELHIVGILDIPEDLKKFKERICTHPFTEWQKLPELVRSIDINLAPLEYNVFNKAKSENKWVEAALVRVPTVASNLGAFREMIKDGETGILCDDCEEWFIKLEELINYADKRKAIGYAAYNYCKTRCVTIYTGFGLAKFVKNTVNPNVAVVLPALNISGGVMVAFEHCIALRKNGYDVTIINFDIDDSKWVEFQGTKFPVLPMKKYTFMGRIDKAVATMWFTMRFVEQYTNIKQRYYLVQGYETDFYKENSIFRIEANQKYSPIVDVQFLTVSKWCQKWLREKYEQNARYLPNGLHVENYKPVRRDFSGKIRILIEGDCGVHYKNVDESFKITNQLDSDKFEIWYMSYNETPKSWYRIDKFLHKVPFEKVSRVYTQCHILVKASFLESFSYPPLEMMATGGYAVVVPNDGNSEYLQHEVNCLLYPRGEIQVAIESIERICKDERLQETLYKGGIETAQKRDWKLLEDDIIKFYN